MWDSTSPWPSDVYLYYKGVVAKAEGQSLTVSVNKYRNNDAASHPTPSGGGTQDALLVKNALLGLGYNDVITRAGGAQNYVNVFTGKGSPEAIGAVLSTLADYRVPFVKKYGGLTYESNYALKLTADLLDDPALSWNDTLQAICDEFIGLDCNGFVGNWLLKADKSLKLTEQSNPAVVKNAAKRRRQSLSEIEEWDIVIWENNSHIAALNQTGSSSTRFDLCQSAGDGPVYLEYTLLETAAPGVFAKSGGENAKAEVGGNVGVFSVW